MYERSETARAVVEQCREILGAESPAARYWRDMAERDRVYLARAAGVRGAAGKEWGDLTPAEQGRIVKAARRARDWARNLGALASAAAVFGRGVRA